MANFFDRIGKQLRGRSPEAGRQRLIQAVERLKAIYRRFWASKFGRILWLLLMLVALIVALSHLNANLADLRSRRDFSVPGTIWPIVVIAFTGKTVVQEAIELCKSLMRK